jgi:hypothetical protein
MPIKGELNIGSMGGLYYLPNKFHESKTVLKLKVYLNMLFVPKHF